MTKLMKIKNLKNYGIPSYILNIWEEHYSPYLLPIQEEAVRNYGILNCGENEIHPHPALSPQGRGNKEGRMLYAPTEEIDSRFRGNYRDKNLLVIAPTSSGKTFIGEMAAVSQVIHRKKIIYLVPLRSLAEEKYRHFKSLYNRCGLEIVVSTRDRREDDYCIIRGNYKMAVMVYEKFNHFLLKYPNFLDDVSLVIIDEMQMINNPRWGPLLEDLINQMLKKNLINFRIIALSALIENQEAKNRKLIAKDRKMITCYPKPETCNPKLETCNLKPTTVLEIDQHRPDRIIFQDKEVKLTPISFSLLYLLAQHRGQVVSYEKMLKELWEDEEDVIYTRINYHICKIRKDILKIMNKKEGNPKKVENIFKTIPGRGLMLNIEDEELKLI